MNWIIIIFKEPKKAGCGGILILAAILFCIYKCDEYNSNKVREEATKTVSTDYYNSTGREPLSNSSGFDQGRTVSLHEIFDTPLGDDLYPSKRDALIAKLRDYKIDHHPKFKNNFDNWNALIDICMQGGKIVADEYIDMYVREMKNNNILPHNWTPPNREYLFFE